MGSLTFTKSIVLTSLFAIALISFAVGFADNNGAIISITDDSNITALRSNLVGNGSETIASSETQYNSILNTSITGGDTTKTGGQFAEGDDSKLSVLTNILRVGYEKIFGSGEGFGVFLFSLNAFMVTMVILYVWKTWKAGDPD